jgi:putative transposase
VNRRRDFEVDPEAWPAFDERALPSARQIPFKARRLAVELYSSGVTLSAIESRTGVERRHFYRLLERCLALHDDGRIFGWRGLVPHARVGGYERVANVAPGADDRRSGAAGAFAQLLKAHPSLAKWLADSVRTKRVSIDLPASASVGRLRSKRMRRRSD